MKKQSPRHQSQQGRCFPIDLGPDGSGYITAILRFGEPVDDARIATHIEAFIISGHLEGKLITMPYMPELLVAPTLH